MAESGNMEDGAVRFKDVELLEEDLELYEGEQCAVQCPAASLINEPTPHTTRPGLAE